MTERIIDPETLSIPELTGLLHGAVAPRPIALVSTVDRAGRVNLAPFSYFETIVLRWIKFIQPSRWASLEKMEI